MTIETLLSLSPEDIAKIDNVTLTLLLKPYFTLTRQPLLPPDKPVKSGLTEKLMIEYLKNNATSIAKFKEQRTK